MRRTFRMRLGAAAALSLLAACGGAGPDVIFRGGPIRTVNGGGEVAEAIAIREGVIAAVGPEREVLALATPRTDVRRALLPGFVGVHEHPALAAAPAGDWVYAIGIDPILVPDLEMPDPGQGSYYERDAQGELTGFEIEVLEVWVAGRRQDRSAR